MCWKILETLEIVQYEGKILETMGIN